MGQDEGLTMESFMVLQRVYVSILCKKPIKSTQKDT